MSSTQNFIPDLSFFALVDFVPPHIPGVTLLILGFFPQEAYKFPKKKRQNPAKIGEKPKENPSKKTGENRGKKKAAGTVEPCFGVDGKLEPGCRQAVGVGGKLEPGCRQIVNPI